MKEPQPRVPKLSLDAYDIVIGFRKNEPCVTSSSPDPDRPSLVRQADRAYGVMRDGTIHVIKDRWQGWDYPLVLCRSNSNLK